MTVINAQAVILPASANLAVAYENVTPLANPAGGFAVNYKAVGQFFEIATILRYLLTTDGTAGNRQANFQVNDADGRNVVNIPAVAVQPPGTAWTYTFATAVALNAPGSASVQTIPIPAVVLYPGWSVIGSWIGTSGPGDQISGAYLVSQRYPSNAPASTPAATVTAAKV